TTAKRPATCRPSAKDLRLRKAPTSARLLWRRPRSRTRLPTKPRNPTTTRRNLTTARGRANDDGQADGRSVDLGSRRNGLRRVRVEPDPAENVRQAGGRGYGGRCFSL